MKIECPCRIGERFTSKRPWKTGRFTLTGMDFFYWESQLFPGVTLNGKRDPFNGKENTSFYEPKDTEEGVRISLEMPDAIVIPGYPLRELGLNTDAKGHLRGIGLTEDDWEYYIYYGNGYGGPMERVRTHELDKLFAPVLPLAAVKVDLANYLL